MLFKTRQPFIAIMCNAAFHIKVQDTTTMSTNDINYAPTHLRTEVVGGTAVTC